MKSHLKHVSSRNIKKKNTKKKRKERVAEETINIWCEFQPEFLLTTK